MSLALAAFVVLICIFIVLYYRYKTKKIMEHLNRILDEAISGSFDETSYNESRLSQIETKLWRFLSLSKLSQNNIEKERDKIKSLISDISHQTKIPLANILLYTELLIELDNLPDNAKDISGQICPQAEKLNFLIQALIKTSRLENGIVTVNPSSNNVIRIVTEATAQYLFKAEAKQIRLLVNEQADTFAIFDPKWTTEALCNIIDNAIKYTPSGGDVIASVTSYEMFVRIDINDTGIGICEDEQAKVFGRFWRSQAVSDVDGIGIGLFLAREIITVQNGYIKVKSNIGKGSTFSIFLPKI